MKICSEWLLILAGDSGLTVAMVVLGLTLRAGGFGGFGRQSWAKIGFFVPERMVKNR